MSERYSITRAIATGNDVERDTAIELIGDAVSALLETHAATGIDLTQFAGVLELVTAYYPRIVIEGTGPTDENCQHADTETGRYWLTGDTSRVSDHEAHLMRRFEDI